MTPAQISMLVHHVCASRGILAAEDVQRVERTVLLYVVGTAPTRSYVRRLVNLYIEALVEKERA